ncbi:MAG: putative zinc-binding protein [Bacteroidales bacterium]|nr:putative zinc-binding protein [Bacteroidales bacterium]
MENESCSCENIDNHIVVTCSGAADLGFIADQVARKMALEKVCKMSCLALFATCSDEQIESFKTKNLKVIDGCNEDCAKKVMANRGIENYKYIRLTDLGYVKGKTLTSCMVVNEIYARIVN